MACTYNRAIIEPTDQREIQFDKEILVYNEETLNTFLKEAFPSFYNQGWNLAGRQIDDAFVLYQVNNWGSKVLRPPYQGWGTTAYDWINENLAKPEGNGTLKQSQVLTRLSAPAGTQQNSDGRINLGSVGGNPCESGFYGYVGDVWELKIPVYKVCYFDVSARSRGVVPNGMTQFDTVFRVERIEDTYEYIEEIRNETGPIIISNDISIAAGKGTSIIPDLISCPPTFTATDYDFGEVDGSGKGTISITNNGSVPIVVKNVTPKKNPNFSIGNFLDADLSDPFKRQSPLQTPFELGPGQTKQFEIFYFGLGEYDINHQMTINYTVETLNGVKVTAEKLTSVVRGRSYKIIVRCGDVDWGKVNVKNTSKENTLKVSIENKSSKDVYLVGYRLSGKNSGNFVNIQIPNVSANNPYLIQRGKTELFDISYDPMGEYGVKHNAIISYDFLYVDSVTNQLTNPVYEEKLLSYLFAEPFKEDIDVIIDEYGGGVLITDENGTYVLKTISRIINKSIPTEKWNTKGLWKCAGERLETFFTGSDTKINNKYYLSVYDKEVNTPESFHQFDISFGHRLGSGSKDSISGLTINPSKVMYKKNLIECYPPTSSSTDLPTSKFQFKNGINGDYVYFIQTDRDQFKDMLDPGNFQLTLCPLSSSSNQLINTGSNVKVSQTSDKLFTLIDDSYDVRQKETYGRNLTDWYYITSGSLQQGVYGEDTDNAWGVVFPKIGLIVLDGVVVDQSCSFNTVTSSIDGQNTHKLFLSISGSSAPTSVRNFSGSFFARSAEKVITETYFCEVGLDEFNYSNSPTYVSGSNNYLKYDYFRDNPMSYITSIGLYNRWGDLVAVGKLKNPIYKDRHKSYVFGVRVRLN